MANDADVLPQPSAVATDRFDDRFAGREAAREALGRPGLGLAVRDLVGREHTPAHRRVAGERSLHPGDLADIDAKTDYLHGCRLAAGVGRGRLLRAPQGR